MAHTDDGSYPFEFISRQPAAPLDRYVESIWYARGTVPYQRERIAPTGSSVAVFVLGDPILETPDDGAGRTMTADRGFLTGPHDRPTINEPAGETFAVGIVATPVGCMAIFDIDPSAVRGRVVDLESVWKPATSLRAQLMAMPGHSPMLNLLEAFLSMASVDKTSSFDRCEAAVALLEADPTRPIRDIAAELRVSHGHLDHEFTKVVGLSPRSLARLLRMRRLLAELDVNSPIDWGAVAAEHGWFDQPHLIRDFKRHTGVTPSQYVAAQRATLSPVQAEDAAGFVPEY